ncbi:Testis-specific serine/threonine-protein kinase 2 [Halotydeus destructor]|nr:Testis-specific serine/threonine-protein kinase 2 [Halotydeus destructor]
MADRDSKERKSATSDAIKTLHRESFKVQNEKVEAAANQEQSVPPEDTPVAGPSPKCVSEQLADELAILDHKTEKMFDKRGYKLTTKISCGAYGIVYKGTKQNGGQVCAVKIMDLSKCGERFKQKFLPRELTMLIQIRHAHVVKIYDIFRSNNKIYIFMEFATNGTLTSYLKKNGPLTEDQARVFFLQMAAALAFMHTELGIAHRDIKIENILLDENNMTKLTDFGFARDAIDPETKMAVMSETWCGTEPYLAPEILQRKPYNPFPSDVWASGVVLFAMVNNKFPFHFRDAKLMVAEQYNYRYHFKSTIETNLSEDYKDLTRNMFEPDPKTRITMAAILKHSWAKQN